MSDNLLTPGFAGPAAPSPSDDEANPPGPPAPPPMPQHFASKEDELAAKFQQVKKAAGQISTLKAELEKLAAFGDTVTMEEVVDGAASLVASDIPAATVAASLADAPEGSEAIQAWVQQNLAKVTQQDAQMQQALAQSAQALGSASFKSLLAHSAHDYFQRAMLAAATPLGRPN